MMRRGSFFGLVTVSAMAWAAAGGTAAADVGDAASTPASCMAIEAAALSPPGSSPEAPGGARDIKLFIDQIAPGQPPGQVFYSVAARLHAGNHAACDEA